MRGSSLRERIRRGALLGMLTLVAAATYLEFVYDGPPSVFAVLLWILVVPMLLSATVEGLRGHPHYRTLSYAGFVGIGVLQYLDGEWLLLSGLFVLAGVVGLCYEVTHRTAPSSCLLVGA